MEVEEQLDQWKLNVIDERSDKNEPIKSESEKSFLCSDPKNKNE